MSQHSDELIERCAKAAKAIYDEKRRWGADVFFPATARAVLDEAAKPAPGGPKTREGWQPIETAPKDGTILAWCDHEADPLILDDARGSLTLYAAHYEGGSHAPSGWHIVQWGGGWADSEDDGGG